MLGSGIVRIVLHVHILTDIGIAKQADFLFRNCMRNERLGQLLTALGLETELAGRQSMHQVRKIICMQCAMDCGRQPLSALL